MTFAALDVACNQFLIDKFMADSSNLFLSASEAKLLHLASVLLVIEGCEATRREHRWDCWYSRAILLANAPVAILTVYNLYKLFRPT